MLVEKDKEEPFIFRYLDSHKLLIQPLDIFGLAPRMVYHEAEISKKCGSIRIGSSIFLTGGVDDKDEPIKRFIQVAIDCQPPESKTEKEYGCHVMTLEEMLAPKVLHGVGTLKGGDVVVVGGIGEEKKETTICLRYTASSKKWAEMTSLPKELAFISVESVNGEYLYTFGGTNSVDKVSSVILKYTATYNTWDLVILLENPGWKGVVGGIAAQLNEDQLILFGGEGKEGSIKMSYIFDMHESTLRKTAMIADDIMAETELPHSKEKYEEKVYFVQRDRCHIYDSKTNLWICFDFDLS